VIRKSIVFIRKGRPEEYLFGIDKVDKLLLEIAFPLRFVSLVAHIQSVYTMRNACKCVFLRANAASISRMPAQRSEHFIVRGRSNDGLGSRLEGDASLLEC
jgi:hypothetical protein